MSRFVQVAMAGDVTEAEQIQDLLSAAGIESQLETAAEALDDPPLKVLVAEGHVELARDAIEALSDAEEELEEPE